MQTVMDKSVMWGFQGDELKMNVKHYSQHKMEVANHIFPYCEVFLSKTASQLEKKKE